MDLARPRFESAREVFGRRPDGGGRGATTRFAGLWVAGSLAGLAGPTVAVVGTRAPSDGARTRAEALGTALARAGVCVLSGLALGVDGAAHAGAVAAGAAPTIGVLGGGHDCFYPRRNRELGAAMIAAGGAVLSPFPPSEPARPPQFLQRNGIVAALADAVVVVEAAARSGALNTASWASDLGIDVFAYPGDVDRPKAAGCNALIRDGAVLVRDANDVLEAIGLARLRPRAGAPADERRSPLERRILDGLGDGPCDVDGIAHVTDAPIAEIVAALVTLEMAGAVRRDPHAGTFALVRSQR